ncbi:MAG: Hsp20/alpha crystallin family protein [Fimbriimonadales bacterium]
MGRRERDTWIWRVGGDVGRLSGDVELGHMASLRRRFWEPRIDLYETESAFVVKAELAGVSADAVQIFYVPDKHSLLIKGEREAEQPCEEVVRSCHQLEILTGAFEREVALPQVPILEGEIHARLHHGFLTVFIPKGTFVERKITLNIRKV